ncbi:hypothetical protein [Zavarzinella formosa]|uniref:hypothetical protein n=1 Tax=Zavarzinella formosa TaxID=360055 RepID=UPI000375E3DA|nr:hypothetical protein [Zavarzinella formosa]
MAEDKTILELDPGGLIQSGDQIPASRDGADVRVVVNTAGTKAASDDDKDALASVNGTTQIGHVAVFSDTEGTIEDGGAIDAIITGATRLDIVLTTDDLAIIRGNVIYRASVDAVLNAQPPSGGGGQFDFSDPINSAYAAII